MGAFEIKKGDILQYIKESIQINFTFCFMFLINIKVSKKTWN